MKYNIAVIPGDGIGPEVTGEAIRVLKKAAEHTEIELDFKEYLAGGCAIDKFGMPLPDETLRSAMAGDAVLLGAVGGPKWDDLPSDLRPENALLGLRKGLELFANLRPAILFKQQADSLYLSPLYRERSREQAHTCRDCLLQGSPTAACL